MEAAFPFLCGIRSSPKSHVSGVAVVLYRIVRILSTRYLRCHVDNAGSCRNFSYKITQHKDRSTSVISSPTPAQTACTARAPHTSCHQGLPPQSFVEILKNEEEKERSWIERFACFQVPLEDRSSILASAVQLFDFLVVQSYPIFPCTGSDFHHTKHPNRLGFVVTLLPAPPALRALKNVQFHHTSSATHLQLKVTVPEAPLRRRGGSWT